MGLVLFFLSSLLIVLSAPYTPLPPFNFVVELHRIAELNDVTQIASWNVSDSFVKPIGSTAREICLRVANQADNNRCSSNLHSTIHVLRLEMLPWAYSTLRNFFPWFAGVADDSLKGLNAAYVSLYDGGSMSGAHICIVGQVSLDLYIIAAKYSAAKHITYFHIFIPEENPFKDPTFSQLLQELMRDEKIDFQFLNLDSTDELYRLASEKPERLQSCDVVHVLSLEVDDVLKAFAYANTVTKVSSNNGAMLFNLDTCMYIRSLSHRP